MLIQKWNCKQNYTQFTKRKHTGRYAGMKNTRNEMAFIAKNTYCCTECYN